MKALAVSGSDLYSGGYFLTAGGKVSAYFAKALLNPLELIFKSGSIALTDGFFQAPLTGPANTSVVVESSSTLADWTPVATNTLPASGWLLSLPTGTHDRQFYRARVGP